MRARFHIALAFGLMGATSVAAQDVELSDEAWAGLMQITYATTADAKCPGASSDAKRLERAMLQMLGAVAASGQDPVAAVQFLETEAGTKLIAESEAELRAKHGVAAEGDEGLCAAIKAEAAMDNALGKMVRFK